MMKATKRTYRRGGFGLRRTVGGYGATKLCAEKMEELSTDVK